MPRSDYKTCRVCERHTDDVGPLSHTRLCSDCSASRFVANAVAMKTMSGEWADHWARRVLLAAHRTLVASSGEQ